MDTNPFFSGTVCRHKSKRKLELGIRRSYCGTSALQVGHRPRGLYTTRARVKCPRSTFRPASLCRPQRQSGGERSQGHPGREGGRGSDGRASAEDGRAGPHVSTELCVGRGGGRPRNVEELVGVGGGRGRARGEGEDGKFGWISLVGSDELAEEYRGWGKIESTGESKACERQSSPPCPSEYLFLLRTRQHTQHRSRFHRTNGLTSDLYGCERRTSGPPINQLIARFSLAMDGRSALVLGLRSLA